MLPVIVQYSDCGLARSSVYFPAMQSVKVWQRIHCKKRKKKKKKKLPQHHLWSVCCVAVCVTAD